jgi:uncharacterized protein YqfB (UPF0267 family)
MYVDFKEVSQIPFKAVLDWLNIGYQETETELRNDTIIVSKQKNLFIARKGGVKGSVINFLADHKSITLRDASIELKKQFQTARLEPKREIPELELHYTKEVQELGITEETAKAYEIGLVKQKSIMAGKVAFRVYDKDGKPIGYVGLKDGQWFYPKGFEAGKHLYNYNRRNGSNFCVLCSSPLEAVKYAQDHAEHRITALYSQSASDEQLELLKAFKFIIFIHLKPENILSRLAKVCYVHTK